MKHLGLNPEEERFSLWAALWGFLHTRWWFSFSCLSIQFPRSALICRLFPLLGFYHTYEHLVNEKKITFFFDKLINLLPSPETFHLHFVFRIILSNSTGNLIIFVPCWFVFIDLYIYWLIRGETISYNSYQNMLWHPYTLAFFPMTLAKTAFFILT